MVTVYLADYLHTFPDEVRNVWLFLLKIKYAI